MSGNNVQGNGHPLINSPDLNNIFNGQNNQPTGNNPAGSARQRRHSWNGGSFSSFSPASGNRQANFFNNAGTNNVDSNATLDNQAISGTGNKQRIVFSQELKPSELKDIRDIIDRNPLIEDRTLYQHIKAVLESKHINCEKIFNKDLSLNLDTPEGKALEKKGKTSLWKKPLAIGGAVGAGFAGLSILSSLPLLLIGGGAAFIFPMIFGGLMQGLGMGAMAGGMASMYKKFLSEDNKDSEIKDKLMNSLENGLDAEKNRSSEPLSNSHPTANDVRALQQLVRQMQMQMALLSNRLPGNSLYPNNGFNNNGYNNLYNGGFNNNGYDNMNYGRTF